MEFHSMNERWSEWIISTHLNNTNITLILYKEPIMGSPGPVFVVDHQ